MVCCKGVKMKWKLPQLEKACCCIPLRRGIISFVYLNLAVILAASFAFFYYDCMKLFISMFTRSRQEQHLKLVRTKGTHWLAGVILLAGVLAELSMTIVALVGLHKKDIKLIRAYLFYSVIYTAAMGITRAINFHVVLWMYEIPTVIIFLGFKFYYILLLRSQVKKMEKKQQEEEEVAQSVELNKVSVINNTEMNTESGKESMPYFTIKYDDINTDDTVGLIVADDGEEKIEIANVENSADKHNNGC